LSSHSNHTQLSVTGSTDGSGCAGAEIVQNSLSSALATLDQPHSKLYCAR
jgi:hypothetical protein